jgi:AraC-like DNA-binding protein
MGVQTFHHSGSRYIASPGTIISVNPDEVHDGMSASKTGYQYRMVYIDQEKVHEMLSCHYGPKSSPGYFKDPIIIDNQAAAALQHALRLIEEEQSNGLESHTRLAQAVTGIFHRHADRKFSLSSNHEDSRVVQHALEYIRAKVTENITLKEIATSVGLSQYHFLRIFKHTTGLPPHAYLLQMRVELAKDAIEKGSSLADAAFQSGFADQRHMTRCFKAVYGLPPGQYKNAFFC